MNLASWLGLGIAFSPVLFGLVQDVGIERMQWAPWIALTLFIGLTVRKHRNTSPARRGRALGLGLLTMGIGLEVVGLLAGAVSVSRAGLPLGVLGLAHYLGRPSLGTAALAFFMIPLPGTLLAWGSPGLESFWARLGAAIAAVLGVGVEARGPLLVSQAGNLSLDPVDGGLALAQLLAVTGWGFGSWRPGTLGASIGGAVRLAPWTVPLQALSLSIAAVLLPSFGREAALVWLDFAAPLGATVMAVSWVRPWRKWRTGAADEPS